MCSGECILDNTAALNIQDFTFTYDDGNTALSGISFAIGKGESVGIVGHNGSGKSTLLMHLVGVLGTDKRIEVGGLPVTSKNLPAIRRKIGYVFQDPRDQLFMPTVIEDVAFGPLNMELSQEEARQAAESALVSMGLSGFGDRVSYHLSGGEMRKAAIAAVLAMSPEIIVMDEPSSGLDPRSSRELAALITVLSCTKIISSHNLAFVRACTDRVILLNNGRIAADGPSAVILDNEELLRANGL